MAIKNAADIVSELIAGMAVADADVDTSIGTFVRKIFDVVAEQVAPAYAESYLISYVNNVDSKSGADLDDFCNQFGMYRLAPRRATGVITFSRSTAAPQDIAIPANTQIGTGTSPQVLFATIAPAVLLKGTTNVSVPTQAVVAGESGNLPSDALTNLLTPLASIDSTTKQSDAMSGGTNAESDAALIARFKRTIFRSMAGTEDMFLGVAIEDSTPDDPNDTVAVQANVIGATKRWREQIQIKAGGVPSKGEEDNPTGAVSTIPPENVKYVYAGSSFFGEDIDTGQILTEGVHYAFDHQTYPPTVTDLGGNLVVGKIYDLDFEYVPMASRNEPTLDITNRVDIWVSGVAAEAANETTYWRPKVFTSAPGPYQASKFIRLIEGQVLGPDAFLGGFLGQAVVVGNFFLPLAWGPIVDFPDVISIGGTPYTRDVDFWVVHDDTGYGYSPSSLFGLEFSTAKHPADNTPLVLSEAQGYFYNRLPADVEARAKKWKLATSDVRAHAAKQVRLALNLAVMYSTSYERGAVQAEIDRTVANWMSNLGFRSVIQVSDLLAVIHGVQGVDNVRFLNSGESADDSPVHWGIERVTSEGYHISHYQSYGTYVKRARDILLSEDQVPVLYDIRYVTKAQNTFQEPG